MISGSSDRPIYRLIGEVKKNEAKEGSNAAANFSQEAEIAGKIVKITLTFNHDISDSQAKKAMHDNLGKVAQLTIAYKLGEIDDSGETTRSLTVLADAKLTRIYTKGNIQELHNITYQSEEVKQKIAESTGTITGSKVQDYIGHHPIPTGPNNSPSPDLAYTPINNFPPPNPTKVHLSANDSSPRGKFLNDSFEVNDRTVATEKSVRAETVDMLTQGLTAKINGLKARIDDLETTNELELKPKLEIELAKTEKALEQSLKNSEGATHASVNAPRFAFLKWGRDNAKQEMVPILSNLRMQTVENAKGETVSAVTRSAAITDFRYGEVSLQELKDLEDLGKCLSLTEMGLRTPVEEGAEKKMKGFYLKDNESKNLGDVALLIKTKALVGYGADALVIDAHKSKELNELLGKIQSSGSIENKFNSLSKGEKSLIRELKIDQTKLDAVISKRSNFLKQLVLQDLQLHLETTPVKSNEAPILYGRTSLVDLGKPANNEAGCIIHERTQGLDMKAIFDELKDSSLVFENIAAAYIDEEGKIHMPEKCAVKGLLEAKLNPVFFNICVQGTKGSTLNKGMQGAINDQALKDLKEAYPDSDELKKLEESLVRLGQSEKNDPNESVLLVAQFMQKNSGYTGINCFGGKDRTGYSVALITHAKVAELVKKVPELAKTDVFDPAMKKVGHQLLSSEGIAAKTAEDNADHTTLKLTRFDLLLYDTASIKGKTLRIAHGIDGLYLALKPMFKKMIGMSPLSISSTPGQLHKEDQNIQTLSKTNSIFDQFFSK